MKKKILGFTLVLFAALVLVACKPKADNAQLVADAKEALTVQAEVSADFKVAAADGDVVITWESLNDRILTVGATAAGETTITVSRPAADTNVDLKATLTKGEETATRTFTVKVTGTGEVVTNVTVTFNVTLPAGTPDGDVFIVGDLKHANMETWSPNAASGKATRNGLTATFTLVYPAAGLPVDVEYKWARQSQDPENGWAAGEKAADHATEVPNRNVTITAVSSTMTVTSSVLGWADLFEPDNRLYADGQYNFRFADSKLRHTFFAAAEGYLLDNVAGGVPLFADSGAALYSPRVSLPVSNYVPVMGWGSAFGTLTADDSTVSFSGGKVGVPGEKTYRSAFTSNPTTFNQWISDDSVSSDAQAFMLDSLYSFVFNEAKTAYQVAPSMASDLPTPLAPKTVGVLEVSTKWSVPVRNDLEWGFHPGANKTGLATTIDADDFVDTFRFALENDWFRARAGGGHFWASSNVVVGAQAFYNFVKQNPTATVEQKDTEWAKVGIKVNDGNIEFEFASELSEWNVIYWLSSNVMSPVHLGMIARDGIESYARTPQQMAFTGPYYLHNYEADKVLEFKTNPKYHEPDLYNYDGYYFVIIERAEIVFAEFEAGNLDVAGLPLTKYEQYKNNPGLRRSPGATTFRMNINGLGTVENQQAQFPSGLGNTWVPEPLLANLNMKKALYWVIDRETLAWDILKTSDPNQFYFSDAYLVDPATGTAFRQTPQGVALGKNLSTETYGYNLELAQDFFDAAVAEVIAAGQLVAGTAANPTVIKLDLSIQAASTSQAQLAEFIKNSIESAFNGREHNIKIEITVDPVTFPNNYYTRTIVGRFDLGTGGISGSTLDAASFLEVFASDNRGGFTIDWGFDTSVANIPVSYTFDDEDIVDEFWSFDAIVSALNGPVTVVKGVEALDTVAINNVIELMTELPTPENYVHATHADAVDAADAAYWALLPRAQAEITNVDKLFDLYDLYDAGEAVIAEAKALADAKAALAGLPTFATATVDDLEDVLEAHKLATGLSADNAKKLSAAEAAQVAELPYTIGKLAEELIAALPEVSAVDLDDAEAVAEAAATYAVVGKYVSVANVMKLEALQRELKAQNVEALVDAIAVDDLGAPVAVKLTERYAIAAARTAFNALGAAEKALVSNEQRLKDLEAAVKPLVDAEEGFLWTLAVASLPDANDINSTHRVQVEAVIRAYNALSNEAKLLETEFDVPVVELDEDGEPVVDEDGKLVYVIVERSVPDSLEILQEIIDVLELSVSDLLELKLPTTETPAP